MAEWVYKIDRKRTRLASSDRGGTQTIRPYIDDIKVGGKPLIELEELGTHDPWMWLNKVVRGYRFVNGKWVLDAAANADIGLWAFEGMTSISDAMMNDLARQTAQGKNVGGGSNVSMQVQADGETLKIGGNNPSHYGLVQNKIVDEVWESQRLPGWLIWTAAAKRDDDPNAAGKVLGPAIAGKALTGEVPRWFVYTFRVAAQPAGMGQQEKHVLHIADHQDAQAAGAKGLGNARIPLDAPKITPTIDPASIVKALEVINGTYAPALAAIRARMGLTGAS